MKYNELNLKKIRETMDLDFAHFTYKKGMCSCCYSPLDLPKRYWRGNVIPQKVSYEFDAEEVKDNEYTYLLFKNADNGRGHVRGNDEIDMNYIEWGFPMEKLDGVCEMLQEQLGSGYKVVKPESHFECIRIEVVKGE